VRGLSLPHQDFRPGDTKIRSRRGEGPTIVMIDRDGRSRSDTILASSMATTVTAQDSEEQITRQLAREIYLTSAGPALVKRAAEALLPLKIPVMPLKGVLLQRLVYAGGPFRPITDVDLLVPEDRFFEAFAALKAAGFSTVRWERGRWQATMLVPGRPGLGIDLHRRLTRTDRAGLTSQGLFQRASVDTALFAAPVMLPCPEDLFAHLLLHATLHWLARGKLHRPSDFEAVAQRLAVDVVDCADHLSSQGLLPHALLILPLISRAAGGAFVERLLQHLPRAPLTRVHTWIAQAITARFDVGHPGRRLAGLALAPSLTGALIGAARDRIESALVANPPA
jgi:hypothetical protein